MKAIVIPRSPPRETARGGRRSAATAGNVILKVDLFFDRIEEAAGIGFLDFCKTRPLFKTSSSRPAAIQVNHCFRLVWLSLFTKATMTSIARLNVRL
jgi:hypothetical protein